MQETVERGYSPEMPPLTGIRVLDLSQAIAGPMCAMFCGDFGADVIKVEPPGGDLARGIPLFADGMSTYYASANRNKKSICLNMKTSEGRLILEKLIAESDIVIVNNPSLESLKEQGLDIETLNQIKPGIIEVAISMFGHTGPLRGTPGYDLGIQAFTGAMALTGDPKDEVPWRFPGPYVDVDTAKVAFTEIMLALFRRDHSKETFPQFIDASLLNSTAPSLFNALAEAATFGKEVEREGNIYAYIHPYRLFKAKDGWIVITIGSNRNWEAFCRSLGREDLISDPRFIDNNARVTNRAELDAILEPLIKEQTLNDLGSVFDGFRVPAQRVQTISEFLHHPQTITREVMVALTDTKGHTVFVPNSPFAASGIPMVEHTFPRGIGEDTERILVQLGYSPADIKSFKDVHAVA